MRLLVPIGNDASCRPDMGSIGNGQVTALRVLVCGSRSWTDDAAIRHRISRLHHTPRHPVTIIQGCCGKWDRANRRWIGADRIAAEEALDLGFYVEDYPADWTQGKRAGPIRNGEMLDTGIDRVLAFHINGSRGTQDTIDQARSRGIPVEVITG